LKYPAVLYEDGDIAELEGALVDAVELCSILVEKIAFVPVRKLFLDG